MDGSIFAVTAFDDGTGPALYVGGTFTTAGGVVVNSIARWDGKSWSPLAGPGGTGVSGSVNALAAFDDGSGLALYVAGSFTTAGGVVVNNIARWNGTTWSALDGPNETGANGPVNAMALFDDGMGPALYAGGSFTTAGGLTVNRIARWNGASWSPLNSPNGIGVGSFSVRALVVFDDGSGPGLYAGGTFTQAGGNPANRIARWDGTAWTPLGVGMNSSVSALTVFHDGSGPGLFAGGEFSTAGGVVVNGIARWNGATWTPLGTGVSSTVNALTVHNDGSGFAVYAGGEFVTASGVTVNQIARWDGSAWSDLTGPNGTGVNGTIWAMATYLDDLGPALYAGGSFTAAGGVDVNRMARWGCIPPCAPDLDGNGVLNFFDIAAFLTLYQIQDPIADWNGDGLFNFFDLAAYLNDFNVGCP